MNQSIGESQITPQVQQQVTPDVVNPQGQQQLFQKAVQANQIKPVFDQILKNIASKIGADQSSRVKNIETAAQKIAQKRLQGRDYKVEDIGDMIGGRLIVKNEKEIDKAIEAVKNEAKQGDFKITKQEEVKTDTYKAHHFDVILPNGLKGELQIHTPQSELEGVANHSLRSQYGEKPENKAVEKLRDLQAQKAKQMPHDKARAITQAIQSLSKQQGGQVSPLQSAGLLSS